MSRRYPREDCPFDAGEQTLTEYVGARWAAFANGDPPWAPFVTAIEVTAVTAVQKRNGVRAGGEDESFEHREGDDAGAHAVAGALAAAKTRTARLEVGAETAPPIEDFKKEDCAFWAAHEANGAGEPSGGDRRGAAALRYRLG